MNIPKNILTIFMATALSLTANAEIQPFDTAGSLAKSTHEVYCTKGMIESIKDRADIIGDIEKLQRAIAENNENIRAMTDDEFNTYMRSRRNALLVCHPATGKVVDIALPGTNLFKDLNSLTAIPSSVDRKVSYSIIAYGYLYRIYSKKKRQLGESISIDSSNSSVYLEKQAALDLELNSIKDNLAIVIKNKIDGAGRTADKAREALTDKFLVAKEKWTARRELQATQSLPIIKAPVVANPPPAEHDVDYAVYPDKYLTSFEGAGIHGAYQLDHQTLSKKVVLKGGQGNKARLDCTTLDGRLSIQGRYKEGPVIFQTENHDGPAPPPIETKLLSLNINAGLHPQFIAVSKLDEKHTCGFIFQFKDSIEAARLDRIINEKHIKVLMSGNLYESGGERAYADINKIDFHYQIENQDRYSSFYSVRAN